MHPTTLYRLRCCRPEGLSPTMKREDERKKCTSSLFGGRHRYLIFWVGFFFVFRNSFDANDWKKRGGVEWGGGTLKKNRRSCCCHSNLALSLAAPTLRPQRRRYSIPLKKKEEKPIVHVQLALLVSTHDQRSAPRRVCVCDAQLILSLDLREPANVVRLQFI